MMQKYTEIKAESSKKNLLFTLFFSIGVFVIAIGVSTIPLGNLQFPTPVSNCTGSKPTCPEGKKPVCAPPLTKNGTTYGGWYWTCM
jgi:hypothetical protein